VSDVFPQRRPSQTTSTPPSAGTFGKRIVDEITTS
jgi:hypothetical protein